METNLTSDCKLVLIDQEQKEVIAIIAAKAGKSNRIVKQLEKAIKEHFVAEDVTISDSRTIDNQNAEFFAAHIYVDGEDFYNDFKIEVVPTY